MIKDNQDELFDIVNENDKVIGQDTRGEVHKNNKLIHRSVGILVFNNRGAVYLQQRSKSKDTDPLKWTISASGHVLSGHTFEETAHRELIEELGLDLPIRPVTKYICREKIETEMQMLYEAKSEGPFKLNKEEIRQGKFFTKDEFSEALKKGKIELSYSGKISLGKLGWK